MISIVRADVGDGGRPFFELSLTGAVDDRLEVRQHFIKFFDGFSPAFPVYAGKRLFVVSAEGGRLDPFEFHHLLFVPKIKMMGKLGDRMVSTLVLPHGLLC